MLLGSGVPILRAWQLGVVLELRKRVRSLSECVATAAQRAPYRLSHFRDLLVASSAVGARAEPGAKLAAAWSLALARSYHMELHPPRPGPLPLKTQTPLPHPPACLSRVRRAAAGMQVHYRRPGPSPSAAAGMQGSAGSFPHAQSNAYTPSASAGIQGSASSCPHARVNPYTSEGLD